MTQKWSPNCSITILPEKIREKFREEAEFLYNDLKRNKLEVVLIPAPDPKFPGHKIRSAINKNPEWYSELYHSEDNLKRHRLLSALNKIRKEKDYYYKININQKFAFHIYRYSYQALSRFLILKRLTEEYVEHGERIFPDNEVRAYFDQYGDKSQ